MIILATTNDVLRVTTSASTAVDVHCSFVDNQTTSWTPGRQNTALATTSTTTVLASPASSAQRFLKHMVAAARGGANTITFEFFDGTIAFRALQVALLSGETLQYEELSGWAILTAAGALKSAIALS